MRLRQMKRPEHRLMCRAEAAKRWCLLTVVVRTRFELEARPLVDRVYGLESVRKPAGVGMLAAGVGMLAVVGR